jgi:Acetyltransferase (GNAT) domain
VPVNLPLGEEPDWTRAQRPARAPLRGSHILLRPSDAATDADPLFSVSHPPRATRRSGPPLQRTTAATEAIYLLLRHAFDDLGYRRVEWKCNALNAASRRAAERFGFTFEGVFRKHQIVKGRNRDTAWYAITDEQWPAIRRGFDAWLAPENMDGEGRQTRSLGDLVGKSPGTKVRPFRT